MENNAHYEACNGCGEKCRVPPMHVPFALDSVYCTPECRKRHQDRLERRAHGDSR